MSDSEKPTGLMTEAELDVLSHTQAVNVLGEDRGKSAKKRIIAHHIGLFPGQVGTIVTGSQKNFHTQEEIPCHVVRYENGHMDYVPMNLPGFCLDKAPEEYLKKPWFKEQKPYLEMFYEEDEAVTYRTRLVKGRPVE